jgi:ornithine--oxo-acid transaminase
VPGEGRGLLIGVELNTGAAATRALAERFLAAGLLTKDTHGNVLRLAPSLLIEEPLVAEIADVVERVLIANA